MHVAEFLLHEGIKCFISVYASLHDHEWQREKNREFFVCVDPIRERTIQGLCSLNHMMHDYLEGFAYLSLYS